MKNQNVPLLRSRGSVEVRECFRIATAGDVGEGARR